MNNLEIVHELNNINKTAEGKILKQIISSLMLGFFAGIPDDVCDMIFNLHLKIKDSHKKTNLIIIENEKHLETINRLDDLFRKLSDEKSKLIIGVLTVSIGHNKLEDFRNILAHLNLHIETLDFRNDISSENMTLH